MGKPFQQPRRWIRRLRRKNQAHPISISGRGRVLGHGNGVTRVISAFRPAYRRDPARTWPYASRPGFARLRALWPAMAASPRTAKSRVQRYAGTAATGTARNPPQLGGNAREQYRLYRWCRRHYHRAPVLLRIAVENRRQSAPPHRLASLSRGSRSRSDACHQLSATHVVRVVRHDRDVHRRAARTRTVGRVNPARRRAGAHRFAGRAGDHEYVRHRTELCVARAYAVWASCATYQPTDASGQMMAAKGQDRRTRKHGGHSARAFSTSELNPITHPSRRSS